VQGALRGWQHATTGNHPRRRLLVKARYDKHACRYFLAPPPTQNSSISPSSHVNRLSPPLTLTAGARRFSFPRQPDNRKQQPRESERLSSVRSQLRKAKMRPLRHCPSVRMSQLWTGKRIFIKSDFGELTKIYRHTRILVQIGRRRQLHPQICRRFCARDWMATSPVTDKGQCSNDGAPARFVTLCVPVLTCSVMFWRSGRCDRLTPVTAFPTTCIATRCLRDVTGEGQCNTALRHVDIGGNRSSVSDFPSVSNQQLQHSAMALPQIIFYFFIHSSVR
jgi:hypothetical protein